MFFPSFGGGGRSVLLESVHKTTSSSRLNDNRARNGLAPHDDKFDTLALPSVCVSVPTVLQGMPVLLTRPPNLASADRARV